MRRTDARNFQTNYTYDVLNRVSGKTYTDGVTPSVGHTYGFGTTTNNGNPQSQTIAGAGLSGSVTQNYTYDTANQLSTFTETSWIPVGAVSRWLMSCWKRGSDGFFKNQSKGHDS